MRAWLSKLPSHGNLRGLLWMVVASFTFALFMLIARIGADDLHVVQVAFMRYFMSLVLVLPVLARLGVARFWGLNLRLHGLRGAAHGLAVVGWFYALTQMPIAEVSAIGFTGPVFITIGAALFLGERVGVHRWGAVAVGLVGALIIIQPGVVPLNAGALAMAAAVPLFAASDLFVKALVRTESPTVIIAVLNVILTVGMAPFAWWFWQPTDWRDWVLAGGMAVFATFSHICMGKAFAAADVSAVQPARFLQLPWLALLGYLAFAEFPSLAAWTGAAVIIASVSYIMNRERVAAAADNRA
ncbi:MAG: DMT family transporter [Pseudomonadota bacterium]|nr:DMT family transporter [Pseudomonadota bacterium]